MPKILLVDDVKLLLEIQKGFLASSNLEIFTAGDGLEALDIARQERPDLIILDKYMPRMDGVTCCSTLKNDPYLKRIPVIIVSNADKPEDIDEGGMRIARLYDALNSAREKAEVLRAKSPARDAQGNPLPFDGILAIQADKRVYSGSKTGESPITKHGNGEICV